MDCGTTLAVNFRTRLGFTQNDSIMTQEQSVLTKIITVFAAEEIILQYNVLGYRVNAYLPKHKLGIETDEQGQNDISIDNKIKGKKQQKKNLVVNLLELIQTKKGFM